MQIRLFAIIIAVSSFSCSTKSIAVDKNPTLIGTWNWTQRQGGFAGKTETAQGSEKTGVLHFKNDHQYSFSENDKLVSEGEYSIIEKKSIYNHAMTQAIHFSDDARQDQLIQSLSADSLILADNNFDGYTNTYVRIR